MTSRGNLPSFLTGAKPMPIEYATGHPMINPLASGPTTTSTSLSLAYFTI